MQRRRGRWKLPPQLAMHHVPMSAAVLFRFSYRSFVLTPTLADPVLTERASWQQIATPLQAAPLQAAPLHRCCFVHTRLPGLNEVGRKYQIRCLVVAERHGKSAKAGNRHRSRLEKHLNGEDLNGHASGLARWFSWQCPHPSPT